MADLKQISLSEAISEPTLENNDYSSDESSDQGIESEEEGLLDSDGVSGDDDEANSGNIDEEVDESKANPGWADAMANILKTNKPRSKKTIVLSKAKKLGDVIKKDAGSLGFEIVSDVKEEKPDVSELKVEPKQEDLESKEKAKQKAIKKRELYSKGRQRPNILDKDRERTLSKIGTKGVVQLFNAIQKQRGVLETKLKDVGKESFKKERILKTIDKKAFLDAVMGSAKSQPVDNPVKEEKNVEEDDKKPISWQVLRDDFMMGGTYKDWDREESKPDISDAMEDSESSSNE